MKAFEVLIDGHFVCRAGIGGGVLTAIVHLMGNEEGLDNAFLSVGGLDSSVNEYVDWAVPTIGVGSEITVRVVEVEDVDPPAKRKPAERRGAPDGPQSNE